MSYYLHKFRGLSELQEAKGGYIDDLEAKIDTKIPKNCHKFELELYQNNDSWDLKPQPHPNILYITPHGRSKKDRRQISLESYKYVIQICLLSPQCRNSRNFLPLGFYV